MNANDRDELREVPSLNPSGRTLAQLLAELDELPPRGPIRPADEPPLFEDGEDR